MTINPEKLSNELRVAGVKSSGCNVFGIVWAEDGHTEIQDRKDVKAVIAKHDPTPAAEETLDEKIDRIITEKLAIRRTS